MLSAFTILFFLNRSLNGFLPEILMLLERSCCFIKRDKIVCLPLLVFRVGLFLVSFAKFYSSVRSWNFRVIFLYASLALLVRGMVN